MDPQLISCGSFVKAKGAWCSQVPCDDWFPAARACQGHDRGNFFFVVIPRPIRMQKFRDHAVGLPSSVTNRAIRAAGISAY
jgi:hypothetical protein